MLEIMKITESFKDKILKSQIPLYVLASKVGFHPSQLSRILNDVEVKRTHDIRFSLLAEYLKFEGKLFEEGRSRL